MRLMKKIGTSLVALALVAGTFGIASGAWAQQKKFKIYLSMSYSGNAWQTETSNLVKALAATPPYDKLVNLKVVISGIDPQAQASAYESMISNRRRWYHQLPDLRDGAEPGHPARMQEGCAVRQLQRHRDGALRA